MLMQREANRGEDFEPYFMGRTTTMMSREKMTLTRSLQSSPYIRFIEGGFKILRPRSYTDPQLQNLK